MDETGSVSQKTFRHYARLHLPSLQPLLNSRLGEAFASELAACSKKDGWTRISAGSTINRITAKINNVILVGDELASNDRFFEDVVRYTRYAAVCEELLQFSATSTMATQNVNKRLVSLARQRLDSKFTRSQEPKDTVQWIINCCKKATAEQVAQQALAYIFGSAYQMPMLISFALYNLCKHPEYLQPLRDENVKSGGVRLNHQNNELPLLDSFMKETARMNPVTIFGMPRKVMTPFTFSDGTHVPAKNWIVVPQQCMMKDPEHYPQPETFDGFRFVAPNGGEEGGVAGSESRLSHPSWRFPFWGSVKQACPARFYVTYMTKMIVSRFIMHYDFTLADENVPGSFAWGPLRVPNPFLAFLLKEREGAVVMQS